ncbi:hypothetical protein CIC12_26780 [Burkholderia sp. SG-MS1]|uniref:hypothetical protein n=1 Tax=Paraburkholderia sp. SG-MS1 TaxID=2023741 RepID=UPI0014483376|nr:hypothetical protein [Paraburkholderia sp. SG-MS1]NKJ50263.1 hypothetical protein [Paraburkholderia sp. SG-MS1]
MELARAASGMIRKGYRCLSIFLLYLDTETRTFKTGFVEADIFERGEKVLENDTIRSLSKSVAASDASRSQKLRIHAVLRS